MNLTKRKNCTKKEIAKCHPFEFCFAFTENYTLSLNLY